MAYAHVVLSSIFLYTSFLCFFTVIVYFPLGWYLIVLFSFEHSSCVLLLPSIKTSGSSELTLLNWMITMTMIAGIPPNPLFVSLVLMWIQLNVWDLFLMLVCVQCLHVYAHVLWRLNWIHILRGHFQSNFACQFECQTLNVCNVSWLCIFNLLLTS